MMKNTGKLMNIRGIITIIMVVSLVLPYVGGFVSYNIFQLVPHFWFSLVIIILTLTDLLLCFIECDAKLKDKIYLVGSAIILYFSKVIFSYVGWTFGRISIGGILMCVASVIQIIVSVVHIRNKK